MYLLFSLFFSFVFLLQPINAEEHLSPFEGDPTGFVFDSVDVISGAYIETAIDAVISSPVPLVLKRTYSSTMGTWQHFPECCLYIGKEKGITYAIASEASGTPLVYVQTDATATSFCVDFTHHNSGIVNTARGPINASTNLKNNQLKKVENGYKLTLSSGSVRLYKRCSKIDLGPLCQNGHRKLQDALTFRLVSETLPSGNRILYRYDKEGRLEELVATNNSMKKEFCSIAFRYKDDAIVAKASDGQSVTYKFSHDLLTDVKSSTRPEIEYRYGTVGNKKILRKKKLPNGRFLAVDYHSNAKVKALVLANSKTALFTFDYHSKKTNVFDSKGNRTRYGHDGSSLLSISHYAKETLYSQEKFIWDVQKGITQLACKTREDAHAKIFLATRYQYDSQGNVTEEKQINNPLESDLVLAKSMRFGQQDPFHNPVEVKDSSGNTVAYSYKQGTNLVTKKLIQDKSLSIKKRVFYFYNEDAVLIREVTDDGTSSDYNSLIGATERHIIEIDPRTSSKYQKEVIEEKYLDLATKTECIKRKICLELDKQGHIIRRHIYDTAGNCAKTEELDYDAHGNLTRHVNPLGQVVTYNYDNNDNCIVYHEQATGLKITSEYDLQNQLILTKTDYPHATPYLCSFKYDLNGNKIASIDRYGNQTSYSYDFLSRLLSITYPTVYNEKKEPIQPQITFTYDILGNRTSQKDPKGYVEERSYAGPQKLQAIKFQDGTNARFCWNKEGALVEHQEPNGILNSYGYDYAGRVISDKRTVSDGTNSTLLQTRNRYYSTFHCLTTLNEENYATIYKYNSKGELISQIQPSRPTSYEEDEQSKRSDFEYDALGRLTRTKRWITNSEYCTEVTCYDLLDRVLESWYEQPDGSRLHHTSYFYDTFGNLSRKQAGGFFEEVNYLEPGRPNLFKNSSGELTRIEYLENQKNALNQFYLEKKITDFRGTVTSMQYDALGREVLITIKDPYGKELSKKELLYDAAGNLAVAIDNNTRTEWNYGPQNRLESIKEAVGTENERATTYTFGRLGYIASSHRSNEPVSYRYHYSRDGKLRKIYQKEPNKSAVIFSEYTYDRRGQITEAKSSDAITVKRSYTAFGDIKSEIIDDGQGYILHYAYDRLGRVTSLTHHEALIEYQYKGLLPKSISRKDASNTLLYQHLFTAHDTSSSPITEELIFNSGTQNTGYDQGLLTAIKTPYSQENITSRDQEGNPLQIERSGTPQTFAYNPLGMLSKEESTSYRYDPFGNLLQKDDQNLSYNSLNQLTSDGEAHYHYDSYGSLKEMISPAGATTFSYNPLHQLSSVQKNGKEQIQYRFDAFGRCQSSYDVDSKTVKRSLFVGQTEIGALDKKNQLIEFKVPKYVTSGSAEGVIAIELNKKTYTPITDLMGNIISLVDSQTKQVSESYSYSAFGKETIFDGQGTIFPSSHLHNPWRYRGLCKDERTGFIHMGCRFYSPEQQRFISEDPLGSIAGNNRYRYAENNPLRYADPTGLLSEPLPCSCHEGCAWFSTGACAHGGDVIPSYDSLPKRTELFPFQNDLTDYCVPRFHGVAHGTTDYIVNSLHDIERMFFFFGANEMDFALHEKEAMFETIEDAQRAQVATISSMMHRALSIDPQNGVYQTYRSNTTTGLEVASLVTAGYGVVKGVVAFRRIAKLPTQFNRIGVNCLPSESKITRIEKQLNSWLGEGTRLTKNKAGDSIFFSNNGAKQVRFDINNSHGDLPHMHIQEMRNNKWRDATAGHRIYPLKD